MQAVKAQLKEWGSSLGVIIPRDVVVDEKLKVGDNIEILIGKEQDVVSKMFGKVKMKRSTDVILKEVDEDGWDD